jgi:hypothetical protein
MIGDHHSRTAGEATLLVRAVDETFGAHRRDLIAHAARHTPPGGHASRGPISTRQR